MGEHKRNPNCIGAVDINLGDPEQHSIRTTILGKYKIEMWPEGYVALNKELATGYHPALEKNLANYPIDEIDIRLATVATYCGVIMDGIYTIESRSELCAILAGRLELLRDYAASNRAQVIRNVGQ